MSSCSSYPIVKRRTVTLDEEKVVQDIEGDPALRIIRPQRRLAPDNLDSPTDTPIPKQVRSAPLPLESATVLVVNASQEIAREITIELSETLPGCTILFAPTLSLALWILKRRSIDLILSSAVLPDGPLAKLHELLELLDPPPELVVLSSLSTTRTNMGSHPGYRFVELRRLSSLVTAPVENEPLSRTISALGADLRNDLNNPLQEIVAMAFVAQTSQGLSPIAEQALSAIERAAETLASVVGGLEDKIRGVVENAA